MGWGEVSIGDKYIIRRYRNAARIDQYKNIFQKIKISRSTNCESIINFLEI